MRIGLRIADCGLYDIGRDAGEARHPARKRPGAAIAYSRGDLARAETLERQALEVDPDYFEAWNTLGAIYIVRKQPMRAIEALTTATRLNSTSGQAFHNLSLALAAARERGAAREAAEKACGLERKCCG